MQINNKMVKENLYRVYVTFHLERELFWTAHLHDFQKCKTLAAIREFKQVQKNSLQDASG